MRRAPPVDSRRPQSRDLRPLLRLLALVRPYLGRLLAATLALMLAAGAVLAFGQVIRVVVDTGLRTGDPAALTHSLGFFLAVVAVLAVAILVRSYLLAWIGERVIADLRRLVFDRVLSLDVGFFETTRTGRDHLPSDRRYRHPPGGGGLDPRQCPAQPPAGAWRRAHARPHQPPAHRTGPARHPLALPAPMAHRRPAAPPVRVRVRIASPTWAPSWTRCCTGSGPFRPFVTSRWTGPATGSGWRRPSAPR